MYLEHFNLSKKPFDLLPDPSFLYLTDQYSCAYNLLEYGVYEQSGVTVLTGEIGSGKTTLVRRLLSQVSEDHYSVGVINNTHECLGDLTSWVALAFGIDSSSENKIQIFHDIQKYIIDSYARGLRSLLVVDEAQNLSPSSLEELRLFTNINNGENLLLQILLIGQPELTHTLCSPALEQLAQRVSVEFHIKAMNFDETASYVEHRLSIAGATLRIFDEDALDTIHLYSGGIPRLVNSLCDYALIVAYADGSTVVTGEYVRKATEGRRIGGRNRFKEKDYQSQDPTENPSTSLSSRHNHNKMQQAKFTC